MEIQSSGAFAARQSFQCHLFSLFPFIFNPLKRKVPLKKNIKFKAMLSKCGGIEI